MKRLELVVVQFEEVKRLIGIGRVPQLRLAHILLDSAVELIMHRMVKDQLYSEHVHFDQLENLRRLEAMRKSDNPSTAGSPLGRATTSSAQTFRGSKGW
ncbi:hypothetical protein [Streptomyces graminilatus]|uniref:hypothetical protein n=1 Tax=Streptomyces graminilatus TaxID=1464070 RepID=UPI0006E32326|nr:hypothetical protein [Streptomyces graminilatus]